VRFCVRRFFGEKSDAGKRAVSIGLSTKLSIFFTRCYANVAFFSSELRGIFALFRIGSNIPNQAQFSVSSSIQRNAWRIFHVLKFRESGFSGPVAKIRSNYWQKFRVLLFSFYSIQTGIPFCVRFFVPFCITVLCMICACKHAADFPIGKSVV